MMGIYTGVLFLQKKNKEIVKNGQAPKKRLPVFLCMKDQLRLMQ